MNQRSLVIATFVSLLLGCLAPDLRAQSCNLPPKESAQTGHREYRGTYTNRAYGYSLVIPEGLAGYGDPSPFYQHGLGISVGAEPQSYLFANGEPNSLEFATPRDAATQHLKYLANGESKIESQKIFKSRLGQLNAVVAFATYACPGVAERRVVYSVFAISSNGSQLYELSLYASAGDFERDKVAFDAIAKSWKYLPIDDIQSTLDKCRLVTSADLADAKAPTFASYRVTVPEVSSTPKLDLKSNPIARTYRTVLGQEIARGPNFAGHYRVAIWGCGSSCAMFAVVNLNTGRVITPNGFQATGTVHFDVDDKKFFRGSQSEDEVIGFRKDSGLLVILGDLDDDESREGAFYFVLENEHLRLVHSTPIMKHCENLRAKQ